MSATAGYSGTPLARKLGIRPDAVVGLLAAPPGIQELLAPLPDGSRCGAGRRGGWT